MQATIGESGRVAWTLAIVAVAASLGVAVNWSAPGIDRYARDWLMRARGPLSAPDDIVIVGIDEPSIARFGRFPWSRQVVARAIDAIAAGQPKVIAVDVIFADPTTPGDDGSLAGAIGRAGNVVVAAQLTESPVPGGPTRWLAPLPAIEHAAAAVGHANVQTEMDGVARQIEVRAADDSGLAFRALVVEAVRIGDGTPEAGVVNTRRQLLVGRRVIPLDVSPSSVVIAQSQPAARPAEMLRGGRMTIDFIGPAGSFEPGSYSFRDVVEGKVPSSRFRGKYVLIGATAALGDRIASPFVHHADDRADQHGALMPGVEVLANAVNTVLRSRFYSETSDGAAFLWAALMAAATLGLLAVAQGGYEFAKEVAGLTGLAAAILLASYAAFTQFQVFPPVVPAMVAFASAGVLGLMRRSLAASSRLDQSIAELAYSGELPAPAPGNSLDPPEPLDRGWFPKGLEGKARTLGRLNQRLLERAKFVDFALRSVEDGLIIASPEGRITFANRAAASILGSTPRALTGQNLLERLLDTPDSDTLTRLVVDRAKVEREITRPDVRPRRYLLRMAALSADDTGAGPVLGIVASLSDITRQYELQQTKNDVVSLVSHEMRTPLTAIQGMTELLAGYEVPADRRRELNLAINDEAKRLTRMITEYLDITRLESGATVLRPVPIRVGALLERNLLLLGPVAAQRNIRLVPEFGPDPPAVVADPDLLSRAVENLVSNAIKYSPGGTEVTVSAAAEDAFLAIEVADQGYGIPAADLTRIFDKFYRVPRVEDAGVPGTGLGLSLVREIAELHGGSVTLKSEVNAGSRFTLRIPRAGPASK